MYKEFFGLRANPFNVNPDPRYLFLTRHTEEALACLTYGIQSRKGFVLLTGEVGTGKTTLINKLLEWLRAQQVPTAFIFNSRLNVPQFLDYMMADFGIPCDTRSKSQILLRLYNWLLERYRAGETAVLIVDEAQNLADEVLEEIRMMTRSEEHTSELQSPVHLVCRLLLEKKKNTNKQITKLVKRAADMVHGGTVHAVSRTGCRKRGMGAGIGNAGRTRNC